MKQDFVLEAICGQHGFVITIPLYLHSLITFLWSSFSLLVAGTLSSSPSTRFPSADQFEMLHMFRASLLHKMEKL